MTEPTITRVALLLTLFNLMVTVAHIVHDMVEFAQIRDHIERLHK